MQFKLIAQQTQTESEALAHVARALKVAIAWVVQGNDLSRKLSSVRFATELFYRQIERLFALEELDGYMGEVCQLRPECLNRVKELKCEHEQFRIVTRKLVLQLDRASPTDRAELDAICQALDDVAHRVLEHNRREGELIVETFLRDTGGES